MKPFISILILILGTAPVASVAQAKNLCMLATEMQAGLIDWYGEKPIAAPSETNEQIWVSQQTGTWTVVKTYADGRACVLAQGDNWLAGPDQDEVLALLDE